MILPPCSVADLAAAGFDYWALGHVHRRTVHNDAPLVVMPGLPQGRDMGEDGPKSATLLRVGDGELTIEERASATLEFRHESVDITDCRDVAEVQDLVAAQVRCICGSAMIVVRLTVTGASALNWQLRRDTDLLLAVA